MKPSNATTKEHVLNAAVTVIRSIRHPREFTIRRLTKSAGVNLNAVNYYYGSKAALVREAVRVIIGRYYQERNIHPGSSGSDITKNIIRICDFLFEEPVAARLALETELETMGTGQSLTTETMHALTTLVQTSNPGMKENEVRLLVWTLVATIHQLVLRPQGASEWLGQDPGNKNNRDFLVNRLCMVLGLMPKAEETR